jgi:hypothetical protein
VALGNYHNCAPKDRIGAEFISIDDALGMIVLLVEAARQLRSFERITAQLPQRLQRLLQNAKKMLRRQKLRG